MQTALQSSLSNSGFQQYEVSAYAQNNRQCRHNLNYWQFGDYLGIGAGAHGKITHQHHKVIRNWKIKHPASYLNRAKENDSFTGASEPVLGDDLAFEFMMNALRLSDGFSLEMFEQRTGLDKHAIHPLLEKHRSQKLIEIESSQVNITDRGRAMVNSMLQDYLAD